LFLSTFSLLVVVMQLYTPSLGHASVTVYHLPSLNSAIRRIFSVIQHAVHAVTLALPRWAYPTQQSQP